MLSFLLQAFSRGPSIQPFRPPGAAKPAASLEAVQARDRLLEIVAAIAFGAMVWLFVLAAAMFAPEAAGRYRMLAGALGLLLLSGAVTLALLRRRRQLSERLTAQMAAEQVASGMRRLAETCPVGMLHCTLDGRVLMANDLLLRSLGRTRTELEQGLIRWDNISPPEWAEADRKAIAEILDHGSCTPFEKEYLRPDGQRVPILVCARMLDSRTRVLAAYIVDLTERKRAERTEVALRRSDQRWLAIEAADLGTWYWDVASDEYGMSARCKQMFGLPSNVEITRDRLFGAVHPDDRVRIRSALAASVQRGSDYDSEIRSLWPDGSIHWLRVKGRTFRDEHGQAPWIQGFVLAIDAQKAVETALRESESRWRGVFEHMHEGFFLAELVRDPATGAAVDFRCLEANPALGEHTGLDVPGVIGKRVSEVLPGFQQQLIDMFARVVDTGEPAYTEVDIPALGGKWFEAHTHRVDGPDRFAVLFMEITRRKQVEARIQDALREKDLLLAEIHHRVKNNLQIIDSLLSLQSGAVTDEKALGLLKECQNRIKSMAIIHQTLYESNNFEAVDFSRFLDSLVPVLVSTYGDEARRVGVSIQASDVMLPISVAVTCGLIANELVSNALKHGFPRGRVGEITIELESVGEQEARFAVADNGIGLPEGFDLTTATTLGLQLVAELTAQLGGSLAIRPVAPTRFELLFPIID